MSGINSLLSHDAKAECNNNTSKYISVNFLDLLPPTSYAMSFPLKIHSATFILFISQGFGTLFLQSS